MLKKSSIRILCVSILCVYDIDQAFRPAVLDMVAWQHFFVFLINRIKMLRDSHFSSEVSPRLKRTRLHEVYIIVFGRSGILMHYRR